MYEEERPLWAGKSGEYIAAGKTNLGELIVMLSFMLYCLRYVFDYSALLTRIDLLNAVLVGLNIALPLFKIIFLQSYSLLKFIITAIIALLIGYSSVIGVNNHFLTGFLIILAMQDVELCKLVRLGFRLKIASITIHLIIYLLMLVASPGEIHFVYRAGAGVARHYFLMGHANVFSAFLVWTCFEYIYLNYSKIRLLHMGVIWAINLTFYAFTVSNTALVVLAAITVLLALDKLGRGFFDKLLTVLTKYTYVILAIAFSFLAIIYTSLSPALRVAWHAIDHALTGRLWFGAYNYDTYGVTWLGRVLASPQVVFWQGVYFDRMVYLDNHYLANLLHFGIIHLIVTAFVFIFFGGKMENREKLIIIAFSLYAIMQNDVTNVVVCFALLIIGKYLYLDKSREEA